MCWRGQDVRDATKSASRANAISYSWNGKIKDARTGYLCDLDFLFRLTIKIPKCVRLTIKLKIILFSAKYN